MNFYLHPLNRGKECEFQNLVILLSVEREHVIVLSGTLLERVNETFCVVVCEFYIHIFGPCNLFFVKITLFISSHNSRK